MGAYREVPTEMPKDHGNAMPYGAHPKPAEDEPVSPARAEAIISELASVFLNNTASSPVSVEVSNDGQQEITAEEAIPKHEDMYRVLVEQISTLVFIAYLERGISEAYV